MLSRRCDTKAAEVRTRGEQLEEATAGKAKLKAEIARLHLQLSELSSQCATSAPPPVPPLCATACATSLRHRLCHLCATACTAAELADSGQA